MANKPIKSKTITQEMAEKIILAKLHKDGFITLNPEAKEVHVDLRKSKIIEAYQEESYPNIKDILDRTAKGCELLGYKVTKQFLDLDVDISGVPL